MKLRLLMSCLVLIVATFVPVARADDTARAELIALWEKMFQARDLAFRAEITTTDKKGRETHTQMLVNWPDRFHSKADEIEFIVIGDSTWMKPKGQNWMKLPISMKKVSDQFRPEIMKATMDGMTNVRRLGDEDVHGVDCAVFSYDFDVKVMGFRSRGTSTVYLAKDTGYPARVVTDGEAMGQRSKTVVDYYYDPSIRIVAPN